MKKGKLMTNIITFFKSHSARDQECMLTIPLKGVLRLEVWPDELLIVSGNTDVTNSYFLKAKDDGKIKPTGHNLWAVLDIMRSNLKRGGQK